MFYSYEIGFPKISDAFPGILYSVHLFFLNALTLQRWIKATDAIGIISKSGRYGGTYAHSDIVFEFASWKWELKYCMLQTPTALLRVDSD